LPSELELELARTRKELAEIIAIEPERNNSALARLNCVDRDIEIFEGQ
jgi:hypothetical protein